METFERGLNIQDRPVVAGGSVLNSGFNDFEKTEQSLVIKVVSGGRRDFKTTDKGTVLQVDIDVGNVSCHRPMPPDSVVNIETDGTPVIHY